MATSQIICGICELRDLSRDPVIWCSECDETLCTDCSEHHALSKSSRQHNTVPIDEYKTLPPFILNIKQCCSRHNEKYQTFCKTHDCPCCRKCVLEQHEVCTDIVILETIIHHAKSPTKMEDIKTHLIEMADNLNKFQVNRENNIEDLMKQRKMIEEEIFNTRKNINFHLDLLQEKLCNELIAEEIKASSQIREITTTLQKKGNEINEFKDGLESIQTNASDLQVFLGMNQIESVASENEKYLQSLVDDGHVDDTSLSCRISDNVRTLVGNLQTFGEIIVDTKPGDVTIDIRKHKQAQLQVADSFQKSVENIHLELEMKVEYNTYSVKGCCMLPDGSLIFSSSGEQSLFILNKDGSAKFNIDLSPGLPYGVTFIDNNTIAVAVDDSIKIINLENRSVKRTLCEVGGYVYGIAYKDGAILCCVCKKGILSINLDNDTVTVVVRCFLPSLSYVTTFENNIYYTDYKKHTVTCCDMSGAKQWEFRNMAVLASPCGIMVDRKGFVYVVGNGSCNVVVISPDRKHYKEVLSKKDGLVDPTVIYYERTTNKLLIPNWTENASVYTVQ